MIGWQEAWQDALYGPDGFYQRAEGPAGHFRTASHAAAPMLARALAALAAQHGCEAIVDVGAGRGELLTALTSRPGPAAPLRLHGVDLVHRPGGLPAAVGWSRDIDALPDGALAGALVVAWELLDTVPCPVVCLEAPGVLRAVLVDPATGAEQLGPRVCDEQVSWCRRWWPLTSPGARAEVGLPREQIWADLVRRARADGAARLLAVDYAHALADRPPGGSLAGYRHGRRVPPVPDGSCDITAHVALDAVARSGEAAGARTLALTDQRTALRGLGVTGRLAPGEGVDAAALSRIAAEAELIEVGGLGAFGWLLQAV